MPRDTRPVGTFAFRFEELVAWQKAMDLAVVIYRLASAGPFARDFAFSHQIHKSAISISSNIAEGFERNSAPDFRRFLAIAKASCGELRSQMHLAVRLEYVSQEQHDEAVSRAEEVSLMIGGLRASLARKLTPKRTFVPRTIRKP